MRYADHRHHQHVLTPAEETVRGGWNLSSSMVSLAGRFRTNSCGPFTPTSYLPQQQESASTGGEVSAKGYTGR
ncbi:MAG: hypothetical protein J6S89_06270 [Paludibacteraceae bacterium]|nr:hypothetical protein [Paludibacteraceae bacterium]